MSAAKAQTTIKSTPAPPPQTPTEQPPASKGKSKGGKIACSITLGCLVAALISAVLGYYIYQQVQKRAEEKLEGISFAELEKNLTNFPSTEELDKIAKNAADDSAKSAQKSGQVGEELSDGEVTITVNSSQRQDKIGDNTPMADYEYIVVNVTLKNELQQEISVFTSNFFLRDGNANQYYEAYLEGDSVEQPIAAWQYLSIGQSIVGNIVFEAKKDVGDLDVMYDGEKVLEFKPVS
ncbi:DUF4352 domain-containing protein [Patescibacteria group bacterium]|nr:DUF4352 domain-containing protein [Patescibacteria group bacterium]